MTLIFGIETSCDETAAAVVEATADGKLHVRANIVASQVEMHRKYGGVFPEVAARMHIETIHAVAREALDTAAVQPAALSAIAVTQGPGLAGSLLVGVNFAKGLALAWEKPLIGVNHLEGHLYSLWLSEHADSLRFPAVCLLISGGHTELLLVRAHRDYALLGSTLDDAVGEAFDKVARVLGLGYPGGPAIERAARDGDPSAYAFARADLGDERPYAFSFSGIKTAVMRAVQPQPAYGKRVRGEESLREGNLRPDVNVADAAASFQAAAVEMLIAPTLRAAESYNATAIWLAGGVSANAYLRQQLSARTQLPVYAPPLPLCTDNAAMIAAAGYFRYAAGQRDSLALDVLPMLPLVSA